MKERPFGWRFLQAYFVIPKTKRNLEEPLEKLNWTLKGATSRPYAFTATPPRIPALKSPRAGTKFTPSRHSDKTERLKLHSSQNPPLRRKASHLKNELCSQLPPQMILDAIFQVTLTFKIAHIAIYNQNDRRVSSDDLQTAENDKTFDYERNVPPKLPSFPIHRVSRRQQIAPLLTRNTTFNLKFVAPLTFSCITFVLDLTRSTMLVTPRFASSSDERKKMVIKNNVRPTKRPPTKLLSNTALAWYAPLR
jgi:hypothetical protein